MYLKRKLRTCRIQIQEEKVGFSWKNWIFFRFLRISRQKGTVTYISPALFLTDLGRFLGDFAQIWTGSSILQIMKGAGAGFWKNVL